MIVFAADGKTRIGDGLPVAGKSNFNGLSSRAICSPAGGLASQESAHHILRSHVSHGESSKDLTTKWRIRTRSRAVIFMPPPISWFLAFVKCHDFHPRLSKFTRSYARPPNLAACSRNHGFDAGRSSILPSEDRADTSSRGSAFHGTFHSKSDPRAVPHKPVWQKLAYNPLF
jgi:hypothetical protein